MACQYLQFLTDIKTVRQQKSIGPDLFPLDVAQLE